MAKIYTRTGDHGETSLLGGKRRLKSDVRVQAYGSLDELNSTIGLLIASIQSDFPEPERDSCIDRNIELLQRTQSRLFDIGSHLACPDDDSSDSTTASSSSTSSSLKAHLPELQTEDIYELEKEIDTNTAALSQLRHFILPGGCMSAAQAHIARVMTRRAERECVKLLIGDGSETNSQEHTVSKHDELILAYLNRLSDHLFVLARRLNKCAQIEEPIWTAKR